MARGGGPVEQRMDRVDGQAGAERITYELEHGDARSQAAQEDAPS